MRNKYIRFFVSSTFMDMELERDLLQEVFDELIPAYRDKGWQVETVDLRWGISEEAGLDNRTMRICKKELAQCMKMSPKPNFIILSGNRYGWIPLPETINMSEFSSLIMSEQEKELFHKWYYLDENALPNGEYVLQGRTGIFRDREKWETNVEKPLGKMFGRNAKRLHNELLYGLSATELEIRQGALSVSDAKEHVLAYIRDINRNTIPNEVLYDFFEKEEGNQDKLKYLHNKLRKCLSEDNIIENRGLDYSFLSSSEYKDQFIKEMKFHLMSIVNNVIDGYKDELLTENERHIEYAIDKARHFVGRDNELEYVKLFLHSSETKPLWIKGPSGIGKSSLLAKIVEEYKDRYDIICRFCGTTDVSSDAISLVTSIWEELKGKDNLDRDGRRLYRLYHIGWGKTSSEKTPESLFPMVKEMVFDRPILVVIDAIDQVYDDNYKDFKQCTWVTAGGNPNVKIILSSLEDKSESTLKEQTYLLPDMGLDAESLLYDNLQIHNRTISEGQRDTITRCVDNSDKSPLFLYLLSQYLIDVPSWKCLKNVPSSTTDLLNTIISDLSQPTKHGELFVRTTLSLLALDRKGLSDSEMLNLLANNDNVYNAIKQNSKHELKENGVRRLPAILWIRLSNDLKAILRSRITEVGQMNTIFHNELKNLIKERYLKEDSYSLQLWTSLTVRYQHSYKQGDKHAIKELAYCFYMIACIVSKNDANRFYKIRQNIVELLTSDWEYIASKKELFPTSLIEDYDRSQLLYFNLPNQQLNIYRTYFNSLKNPISAEQVILYFKNLPQSSSIRKSIEQTSLYRNNMENVLSDYGNVQYTHYIAKEIGESPCLSEDGTTIASVWGEHVSISNLVDTNLSKSYNWNIPIIEMICDNTSTICAIRTTKGCYLHDVKDNNILVNVKMSDKGWMSLSADGLSFICGDNGRAYLYQNHKLEESIDCVRNGKISSSGNYVWLLYEDGILERYGRENKEVLTFPITLKNDHDELYNPFEASGAKIIACSDERCCCRTPTATINIRHFVQNEQNKFESKIGNQHPVFAYSNDGQQYIDDTGRYWIIDDNENEHLLGHFYLKEQLSCINRSFTKALSAKELRVFDFIKEVGNYNVSETYQWGYINHAQCSNKGNEIVVSVGKLFAGPFAGFGKTEALRYSSNRMFAWTPDSNNPLSGIYSSAMSPNANSVAASILGNSSKLIICNLKHDSTYEIDIPKWQTGCTDIVYSSDSNYVFAITGDYIADPSTLFLYVITGVGKTLFIKEMGWEYNRNSLYICNNNRFLFLLCGGYAVYDLIEERDIVDDAHRLPCSFYSYFQEIAYCTLSKEFFVMCPSTNMVFSSDEKNNLLYQYDIGNLNFRTYPCNKVIIGCSSTGRYHYYLDNERRLYIKDWLRSDTFEHLIDDVLWVVPALDERHVYITLTDYTVILYNNHIRQIEQKAYRGMTTHQQACAQGLMTVNTKCEVSLYKAADFLKVNIPAVTTFVRRWNLETKQQEMPSAICPMCGGKIEINDDVKRQMKEIPQNIRYEDWDNPELFGHVCPHCNAELQFNPYIV